MELSHPVVVVSAFGRGHWLAAALAHEGLKTILIDISPKLGVWPSEDVEGPFGFFRNERISESQMERLYFDDPYSEVSNGFTLWLKDGPLECKGPLTKFKLESSSLAPSVREILNATSGSAKNVKTLYRQADSVEFNKSWLLHLSHQLASTTYCPNGKSAQLGEALPLFSSFLVRQATRNGLEKSLEWLKTKNVEVVRPQAIEDISFGPGGTITGLELQGEKHGLLHAAQVVWMLSSEETHFLSERLGKYFFPEGALEPEWSWVRYRIGLKECFEREQLPMHMVLMDDLESPWTHENMMILQRTTLPDQFDVWMRIPAVQRFNKEYLTLRSQRMVGMLTQRMSQSEPQVLTYPQEYYYTYAQLGASRFPLFTESQASLRSQVRFKNLQLDGPEKWTHYNWTAYFDRQEVILGRLVAWWKDILLKKQKEQRKEDRL